MMKKNKNNRICMLAYTFYENDNRVMRYAESLVEQNFIVDVIALRRENRPKYQNINGINVHRIQRRITNENSKKFKYFWRILKFFILSSIILTIKHIKNPYTIIHVHSIPDFEVFATWAVKMTGTKIILDIHDLSPELYMNKFGAKSKSLIFQILIFIEKVSILFSNKVIIANHLWEKKLHARSLRKKKSLVIMNYPDPRIFFIRSIKENNKKFIICYPGTINRHQGLDIAVEAFALAKAKIPNAEFHIYGEGAEKSVIDNQIKRLALSEKVFIKKLLPLEKIAEIMAQSDLGIVPKRNDFFGSEAFSTKILEFMALGIPLLISDTKIDKYYFNENIVRFFKAGDVNNLAENIIILYNNPALRKRYSENALNFIKNYNWNVKKIDYLKLIENLS
jgi:glycosyltransferase involved in cell wall biosynthesis